MPLSCASPDTLADAPPLPLVLGDVLPDVEPLLMEPDVLGLWLLLGVDDAPPETDPLPPDDNPGELDVPDVVPLLPGDAAGVPDPCASRLHASKSAGVGSAANAALVMMSIPATVSIAVARVNLFI